MKLLYVSDSFINSSVFSSQVHTLCNYHADNSEVTLLCLCDKEELATDPMPDKKYKFFKTRRVPLPFIPLFNMLMSRIFHNYAIFLSTEVIHCRGPLAAAFAIFICKHLRIKKPIIADMRGVMVNEIENSNRHFSKLLAIQAKRLEDFVFFNSDFFFFVTKNMKDHYKKKYPGIGNRYAVFPTIVDEKYFYKSDELRWLKRQELKLVDHKVYVYCGGVSYWQNIDKIVARFHSASQKDPSISLLMLVNDQEAVLKIMNKLEIVNPNIILLSISYHEVGQYLNAADYGIIIRDDSLINWVASPTKINEYLACGLKIIDKIEDIGNPNLIIDNKYSYTSLSTILEGQQRIYKKLIKNR